MFQSMQLYLSKQKIQVVNCLNWGFFTSFLLCPSLVHASGFGVSLSTCSTLMWVSAFLLLFLGILFTIWGQTPTAFVTGTLGCAILLIGAVDLDQSAFWQKENKTFIQRFEKVSSGFSKETNEFLKFLSVSCPKKSGEADVGLLLAFSEKPELVFTELSQSGYFSITGEKEEDIKELDIKGVNLIYTHLSAKVKKNKAQPISLVFNPLVLSVSEKFPDLSEERFLKVYESPLFFSLSEAIQNTLLQKSAKGQQIVLKKLIQKNTQNEEETILTN
jgi:hypothetical protein